MRGRGYYDRQVETLFAQRRCGVHDRPGITSRAQPDMTGQRDLGGVAANVAAVRKEHVALVGELLGRTTHGVPVLSEASDRTQRALFATAADADRRMRPLTAFGSQRALVNW